MTPPGARTSCELCFLREEIKALSVECLFLKSSVTRCRKPKPCPRSCMTPSQSCSQCAAAGSRASSAVCLKCRDEVELAFDRLIGPSFSPCVQKVFPGGGGGFPSSQNVNLKVKNINLPCHFLLDAADLTVCLVQRWLPFIQGECGSVVVVE